MRGFVETMYRMELARELVWRRNEAKKGSKEEYMDWLRHENLGRRFVRAQGKELRKRLDTLYRITI
jgi:hypothetical protein